MFFHYHVLDYKVQLRLAVHAGLIPDIVDAFPDVKIAGSKVALMYLKGLTNRDFTQNPVKGGDKIDLGKGIYLASCFHTCFHTSCCKASCGSLIHAQLALPSVIQLFYCYVAAGAMVLLCKCKCSDPLQRKMQPVHLQLHNNTIAPAAPYQ